MNHFHRDMLRRLAGNENDATPILLEHAGQLTARKSNAAEHVHFEESQPIGVGNFSERFDLEDAEIVHQNIGVRNLFHQHWRASGSPRSASTPRTSACLTLFLICEGRAYASFRAAVNHDFRLL